MGSFRITYKKGESYTARWKDEQNNLRETPLSIAAGSGATLEIISSAGKKTFVVRRSESAPDSLQQLHIVATQHQQLVYMAGINLTQTATISGGIPTNKLSTGILQITLFSSNWHPLAERICFVNNNEAVIIPSIQFTQTGFEKRAKNSFDIILPDSLTGNFSIAITDKGIGADSSSNIISQLLLSGELKGTIYKPWYYVSNNSDSVAKHLGLVMLTNGWRRYRWDEIVAGRMPVIKHTAEENYFIFSGKIIGANKRQLASPGRMYAVLKAKDSSRQITSVDIQPDGSFADSNTILFDSTTIISQFSNKAFVFLKDVQFINNITPAQPRIALDTISMLSSDTGGNARLQLLAGEAFSQQHFADLGKQQCHDQAI